MAGSSSSSGSGPGGSVASNPLPTSSHQAAPKILLAKPALVPPGKFPRGVGTPGGGGGGAGATDDDSAAALRSRLPSVGSLNLLSDSWDFITDRFLPFLTDNTDFTVVGIIGPPGAGKSRIMNEIYGYDATLPGMLPPFAIESEETRAMAKHCTVGIEPRISSERIILLDTQPVFSPSVLAEMIRPDGSSTISVISGESLSAELAHELMTIQLGVFLASVCHIFLVVSEGVHDLSMWRLMSTVDLLKHGIPDPSSISLSHPQGFSSSSEKENKDRHFEVAKDYMATPVFVQTKLRDEDFTSGNAMQLKKALERYFSSSSFMMQKCNNASNETYNPAIDTEKDDTGSATLELFLVPTKDRDDSPRPQYESYISVLWKIRDQVLSTSGSSFSRTLSERDWLKNSAKIWDAIKSSPIITDYCRTLQSSGMFRR